MRIGVMPELAGLGDGICQYSLVMLRALEAERLGGGGDEFVLFTPWQDHSAVVELKRRGWSVRPLEFPSLGDRALRVARRLVGEGPHRAAWRRLRRRQGRGAPECPCPDEVRFRPEISRWFRRCGVELMLYPAPVTVAFEARVPYVMAIHDLQHRLQPKFPEVSAEGEWERREYLFRNGARYATLLLADSEVGREDILRCYGSYGVTPDRVKVLPFAPACPTGGEIRPEEQERVRHAYRLPPRYLFYPGQFWPHKNHQRIVEAVGRLKEWQGLELHVVFTGSSRGFPVLEKTFREVMTLAERLGLGGQVHWLGYVPPEDMASLYAGALGLILPTFFGPTNIPVVEAWALGCPVLTSDLRGIREQVGDAGLLVDPRSAEAIARGMQRLWEDAALREALAERGHRRFAEFTPEAFGRRLAAILREAKERVQDGSAAGVPQAAKAGGT